MASKRAHSQQGGVGGRLSAICEAVGVPQLGFSGGGPAEGLREESTKAHLGTLARALPASHPGLLHRCESNWICPGKTQSLPHSPQTREIWDSGTSPPLVPESDGRQVPPGGAQTRTKMEAVMQLTGKCFRNGLQVSLQKWKRKKKNPLGCNLFLGNVFLKGVYMPWKQIPEAQFQLISAKLATANEHHNCQ